MQTGFASAVIHEHLHLRPPFAAQLKIEFMLISYGRLRLLRLNIEIMY